MNQNYDVVNDAPVEPVISFVEGDDTPSGGNNLPLGDYDIGINARDFESQGPNYELTTGASLVDLLSDVDIIISNAEAEILRETGAAMDLDDYAPYEVHLPWIGFKLFVPAGYIPDPSGTPIETAGGRTSQYDVESVRMETWNAATSTSPIKVALRQDALPPPETLSFFTTLSADLETTERLKITFGESSMNDYRQMTAIPHFSNMEVANASLIATGVFGDPNDPATTPSKGIFVLLDDIGEIRMTQGDGGFGLGNTRSWGEVLGADEGAFAAVTDNFADSEHISLTVNDQNEIRAVLKDEFNLSNTEVANLIERMIREAVIPPNNHDAFIGEFDPTTEATPQNGRYALAVDWAGENNLSFAQGVSVEVSSNGLVTKMWTESDPAALSTFTAWDVANPLPATAGTYVASGQVEVTAGVSFATGQNVTVSGGFITGVGSVADPIELENASQVQFYNETAPKDPVADGDTTFSVVTGMPADGLYVSVDEYQGELGGRGYVEQADIVEFKNGQIIARDHPTLPGHRSAFLHVDENGNALLDDGDQELQQVHCQITATGERWVVLKDGRDLMTRSEIQTEYFSRDDATLLEQRLLPMVTAISPAWWDASGVYHNRVEALHPSTFCKSGSRGSRLTWWSETAGVDTYWER